MHISCFCNPPSLRWHCSTLAGAQVQQGAPAEKVVLGWDAPLRLPILINPSQPDADQRVVQPAGHILQHVAINAAWAGREHA